MVEKIWLVVHICSQPNFNPQHPELHQDPEYRARVSTKHLQVWSKNKTKHYLAKKGSVNDEETLGCSTRMSKNFKI